MFEGKPDSVQFDPSTMVPFDPQGSIGNLQHNVREERYIHPLEELGELPHAPGQEARVPILESRFARASTVESVLDGETYELETFLAWFTLYQKTFAERLAYCRRETDPLKRERKRLEATSEVADVFVAALYDELAALPSAVLIAELFTTIKDSSVYHQLCFDDRVKQAVTALLRKADSLGVTLKPADSVGARRTPDPPDTGEDDTGWNGGEKRIPRPPTLV